MASTSVNQAPSTHTGPAQNDYTTPPLSIDFYRNFLAQSAALTEELDRLATHPTGPDRADALEHAQASLTRLSSAVRDATASFIPARDQRTYADTLKFLSTRLAEAKAPRAKFAFKSGSGNRPGGGRGLLAGWGETKKNASAISLEDAAELAQQRRRGAPGYVSSGESSWAGTPAGLRSPASEAAVEGEVDEQGETPHAALSSTADGTVQSPSTTITIPNKSHAYMKPPPTPSSTTNAGTATLSDLSFCVVDLSSHSFATLTLLNINHCLLLCGHVTGAVHATNIQSSKIVVASQQFRMHDSNACSVYLHTASRPIIEGCTGIGFAALPSWLRSEDGDGGGEEMWRQVDDF
ncbi:hypothetical protein BAUCODRAFT_30660, partial [Baudoinia panamericana UAMH 10762]